jgi:hypothetical protein
MSISAIINGPIKEKDVHRILVVGMAVVGVTALASGVGCDEAELAALAEQYGPIVAGITEDADLSMLKGVGQAGQCLGACDQQRLQQQDQLRDGSCGDGPALDGTGAQVRNGSEQGSGDQARLRDGSCDLDG